MSGDANEVLAADRSRVAELLPQFADANFRQTWSYAGAAARRLGAHSEWVEVRRHGQVISLANIRVKSLPLGLGGVAFVSGGPLVRQGVSSTIEEDAERFNASVAALVDRYVNRRALKLRVHAGVGHATWNDEQTKILAAQGFVAAEGGARYRTLLKSIDAPEDALRKSLAQKWRNQLNGAERNALTVERGADPSLFKRFEVLFQQTLEQKGFSVDLDLNFFRAVREESAPGEPTPLITLIRSGDQDVSGHLGMYVGDTAVYLLGGTNAEGRRLKAAYLAQWESIRHARAQGCTQYDTGGIDPLGNPGVFHFKEGLGAVDVTAAGPAERVAQGFKAVMTGVAERVYRRIRARGNAS